MISNNRSGCRKCQQRICKAVDCCNKAIEIESEDALAWNNKGNSLSNFGRYEEALNCYDKAIHIDPEDAYPRFNRSEAFFALHRWDQGLARFP